LSDSPTGSHDPRDAVRVTRPRLEFLGEQDGPPERLLKNDLKRRFAAFPHVSAAYLARLKGEGSSKSGVILAIRSTTGTDVRVVQAVADGFKALFARDCALDICFLTSALEAELRQVCPPFYELS
jgi:hypothetical protein